MPKPTTDPTWATDATYDADASANKIEPPTVLREEGFERGEEPGAQHLNHVLATHGEHLGYLHSIAHSDLIDGVVRKRLSLSDACPQGLGSVSPGWEHIVSTVMVWRSAANVSRLVWGINAYVAELATMAAITVGLRGVELDGVTVQMLPGVARTGTDRMQVQIVQSRFEGGVLVENIVASAYGLSGAASLDTLIQTGAAHACDPIADYSVRVISGNDGASNQDLVYGATLHFKPVKLPL